MRNCGEREYGELLLLEAQKNTAAYTIPCLVSETGGVYERVTACVKPFSNRKIPAIIVAGMAILLFAFGFIGFTRPMVTVPLDIRVSLAQDETFSHIDGMEQFFVLREDGIALDRQGFLQYAASQGLDPETSIDVYARQAQRATVTSCYTVGCGGSFVIGQLETKEVFFPYYDSLLQKLWGLLYRII